MNLPHLFPGCRIPRTPRCGFLSLVLGSCLALSGMAQAQQPLTAERFLEPQVERYSSKYQDVQDAIERLQRADLAGCRELLQSAKQKNPELAPADTMLAQLLFRANQVALAENYLQQAVRNSPDDPAAYIYLAEYSFQQRGFAQAALLWEKGAQVLDKYTANPKRKRNLQINVYSGQALLAESYEDWTKAKGLLEQLKQIDPKNAVTLTRLGRVLFKMAKTREDQQKAYNEFMEAYNADPESTARAEINMALLYEQQNNREGAEGLMKLAVERDGNNAKTRTSVAQWAIEAGKMDLAKENAEAALRLDPASLQAKLLVGLVARFNNDLDAAEKAFTDAHVQSPRHLGALTQLTLVLIEQTDPAKQDRALEYGQLNATIYSDRTKASGREAAITYGWVLYKRGQTSEAQRIIQEALASGAVTADSAYHAAQIFYDVGLREAARKLLEPTLKENRSFPTRAAAEQLMLRIQRG